MSTKVNEGRSIVLTRDVDDNQQATSEGRVGKEGWGRKGGERREMKERRKEIKEGGKEEMKEVRRKEVFWVNSRLGEGDESYHRE